MNILGKFASVLLLFSLEAAADTEADLDITASIDTGAGIITLEECFR
jgi:hypothetical protein